MHIPILELTGDDKRRLFAALEPRPHNLVLTAHYHFQEHQFLTSSDGWNGQIPLHHLIHVTACGSWWQGALDEHGLPHTTMRCGAPNGYSVLTCDGSAYSIRFKAARRPAEHQMNIYAAEEIEQSKSAGAEVWVNVFAGSAKSMVKMRVRGNNDWSPLVQTRKPDPYFVAMKDLETSDTPPTGKKLPKPVDSPHLWRGTIGFDLPVGVHVVEVQTTDMFGQNYSANRIVRVV
jgi:hypothetical protein